jgi:DNA mismatch endonuclease, patch repair protein
MEQVHPWGVTPTRSDAGGEGHSRRRRRTVNLGRGLVVPYPEPASQAATNVARGNRRTNTRPEVLIRSALHRRGLRFRKDHLLRVGGVRVRPDLAFTRWKVAAFVDGCFWHRCPDHSTTPSRNPDYWIPKLQANVERDRRVDGALMSEGWVVIRVWEHENVDAAATRIETVVRRQGRP